ncbi:MAG: hypothetical protein ABI212_07825 [Burkholderiaceae bacterium]
MKDLILIKDPEIDLVDMQTLVGIAHAIEHESVQRYTALAERMQRQGEAATAAAFRVLLEEEKKHIDGVAHWAAKLGQKVPSPDAHAWQLPEDMSSSWADVAGSALLSPYRAFALAVENEQRAFTFYTYLAARAEDPRVMVEAEQLAVEELQHAALLRRFRRRAWHRERRPTQLPDRPVESPQALSELIASHEAQIAHEHHAIAQRLRQAGDEQSAQLIEVLSRAPSPLSALGVDGDDSGQRNATAPTNQLNDPVHLLMDAQKPLEAFSETLEAIMRTTQGGGELFAQAETAMVNVVQQLARISLQAGHRMQTQSTPHAPPVSAFEVS